MLDPKKTYRILNLPHALPVELRRTGLEYIDWQLVRYGIIAYTILVACIIFFSSITVPATDILFIGNHLVSDPSTIDPNERIIEFTWTPDLFKQLSQDTSISTDTSTPGLRPTVSGSAESIDRPGRVRRRSNRAVSGGAGLTRLKEELREDISNTWTTLSAPTTGTGKTAGFNGLPKDNLEARLDQVTRIHRGGQPISGGSAGMPGIGSGTGHVADIQRSDRSTVGTPDGVKQVGNMGTTLTTQGVETVGEGGVVGGVEIASYELTRPEGHASSNQRTDATVLSVIREHINALKYQYGQALKLNPNLQGVIKVKLSIEPDGRVRSVDLLQDSIGDSQFSRTVRTMIRGWRFTPVSSGKSTVTLTLPFSPN